MRGLVSRISWPETVGLSLSVISPTITAAFNIVLVAQAAGPAAPLAFAIGTVAMVLVSFAFMAFTRRLSHAGSAYAYITHAFGNRAGFVAGWTLLLAYLGYATGFAALAGSFGAAAIARLLPLVGPVWLGLGAAAILLAWRLAFQDMKLAGRLMLGLEIAAILAILVLCVAILVEVQPDSARLAASFTPSSDFGGWSGIGYGLVFTVLSFAGFEGAATLGEETINARRNIPLTLLVTVLGSGLYFVFVAYCEVVGFGEGGIHDLATSEAPLNDLALRFGSRNLATALDIATATSCFSGILGGLNAAARVLFALGRAGLAPNLASIHRQHGTPSTSLAVAAALLALPFLIWSPFTGPSNYYSYVDTIATLALILIYIAIGAAEMQEAWRERQKLWSAACVLGPLVLLWALYCSVYPEPDFPNNLWPYVTLAWVMAALALIKLRPALARAPIPDFN